MECTAYENELEHSSPYRCDHGVLADTDCLGSDTHTHTQVYELYTRVPKQVTPKFKSL